MTPQDGIPYTRLFPWLYLFRAIGMAGAFRPMVVGLGAVCALGVGNMVIDWFGPAKVEAVGTAPVGVDSIFGPVFRFEVEVLGSPHLTLNTDTLYAILRPWHEVFRSVLNGLDGTDSPARQLRALAHGVWGLLVWSVLGIANCRLAAHRLARDEDGSFREAVKFGIKRSRHGIVSPLIPACAALLMVFLAVLAALPGRLPLLGSTFATLMNPLILGFSLIATFLIIATLLGWPLMLAAIAYDDCDGFGGLSRSYSLWTGRPWQFVGYWFVATVAGVIAFVLIQWMSTWTFDLAAFAYRVGMGQMEAGRMARSTGDFLLESIVSAYGISFFWTSATIVYALLRQGVDRMPFERLAPDDSERPERDPLPVVGMPAMAVVEPTAPPL